MSTTAPGNARPARRWSAGRVVGVVAGTLLGLVALAFLAGGIALVVAQLALRDDDGYFMSPSEQYRSAEYALTAEEIELLEWPGWLGEPGDWATLRVKAEPTSDRPLFVGIARAADVDRYLAGVGHDRVTDVEWNPFEPDYETSPGGPPPTPPGEAGIWRISATGTGPQELTWELEEGSWSLVVMNADGSRAVASDVRVGAKVGFVWWIAGALLAVGIVLGLCTALVFRASGPRA